MDEIHGAAFSGSGRLHQADVKTNEKSFGGGDHLQQGIDLNTELIRNKHATYFFRMRGDAMQEAGIFDNDVLIVDRSVKPVNGKIILAVLNGELLVRRFHKNFSSAFLIPENSRYKNINLSEFTDFTVWGVVTFVIHQV